MAEQVRPDYYCPKCQHGLLEPQVFGSPKKCPKCKGLVDDAHEMAAGIVPMFIPKLAGRLSVKVGTPRVEAVPQRPEADPIFKVAEMFVLVKKVFNRIADALENDGKEPELVVGSKPSDLHLLGEAFEAIGRHEAAKLAYAAEADYSGDPDPVFEGK